jgi:hypothetical protein
MKPAYRVEEWKQMQDSGLSFAQKAVSSVTPFTGLTANALAHLRDSWITWDWEDQIVRIDVPKEASNNSHKLATGKRNTIPAPLVEREEPCNVCKQTGDTDRFENLWNSRNEVEKRRYTTVLHRDLAAPAVDFLENHFVARGREEMAVTPGCLNRAANDLAQKIRNGVPDEKSYTKLLRTGPVLYCEYGLSPRDIAELSPYQIDAIKQIVKRTGGINFEYLSTLSFLKLIDDMGPVTVASLADELDQYETNIRTRLDELRAESRVTVENNHQGPPASTWKTTVDWQRPFECNNCDFSTYSLNGIRKHRSEQHR